MYLVFTGLSVRIARFHSQNGRGAYARDKTTGAETVAETGRGAYARGGRMGGILRY